MVLKGEAGEDGPQAALALSQQAFLLTFWLTPVPGKGLQGGGTPWRCRTCSTCLTTASWQNRRCSCRGTGWSVGAGPQGGASRARRLTFSCSMCFLCCRMRRTSWGSSGSLFPASTSCTAA